MEATDLGQVENCLYFIICELAIIIGLWVGKALNWWKW